MNWLHVLWVLCAYLLGAVPFGYLIVRFTKGRDIRQVGSGNIGATNVLRSAGKLGGAMTLLLDVAKGYLAVWLAQRMFDESTRVWEMASALAAIVGHIFPVFLRFRGGKGVAVGCGAYLAGSPAALGSTLVVFALTLAISRYVSLGSIAATAAFPLLAYLFDEPPVVVWGGIAGAVLIISKHHSNIRRLFGGSEHKLTIPEKAT